MAEINNVKLIEIYGKEINDVENDLITLPLSEPTTEAEKLSKTSIVTPYSLPLSYDLSTDLSASDYKNKLLTLQSFKNFSPLTTPISIYNTRTITLSDVGTDAIITSDAAKTITDSEIGNYTILDGEIRLITESDKGKTLQVSRAIIATDENKEGIFITKFYLIEGETRTVTTADIGKEAYINNETTLREIKADDVTKGYTAKFPDVEHKFNENLQSLLTIQTLKNTQDLPITFTESSFNNSDYFITKNALSNYENDNLTFIKINTGDANSTTADYYLDKYETSEKTSETTEINVYTWADYDGKYVNSTVSKIINKVENGKLLTTQNLTNAFVNGELSFSSDSNITDSSKKPVIYEKDIELSSGEVVTSNSKVEDGKLLTTQSLRNAYLVDTFINNEDFKELNEGKLMTVQAMPTEMKTIEDMVLNSTYYGTVYKTITSGTELGTLNTYILNHNLIPSISTAVYAGEDSSSTETTKSYAYNVYNDDGTFAGTITGCDNKITDDLNVVFSSTTTGGTLKIAYYVKDNYYGFNFIVCKYIRTYNAYNFVDSEGVNKISSTDRGADDEFISYVAVPNITKDDRHTLTANNKLSNYDIAFIARFLSFKIKFETIDKIEIQYTNLKRKTDSGALITGDLVINRFDFVNNAKQLIVCDKIYLTGTDMDAGVTIKHVTSNVYYNEESYNLELSYDETNKCCDAVLKLNTSTE